MLHCNALNCSCNYLPCFSLSVCSSLDVSIEFRGTAQVINICAGNSGGPAFADLQQAKVAGVAFSKLSNADNVGYIIPYQIIRHFLQVCYLLLSSVHELWR